VEILAFHTHSGSIGKDCYKEESFDVECDETSEPPRAFLRSIKMELMNITLDRGSC
jgi:hypothetical protein